MDNTLWRAIDNVEGWLTRKEAELLWKYNTGIWCEVGSWKGKSTLVLATKGKGYAVDWFKGSTEHGGIVDTYDEYMRNIQLSQDNITTIRGDYRKVADKVPDGLDLLFLDAEHTYEATKESYELYAPKVKKGGVIILHDVWDIDGKEVTPWQGVTDYVNQELLTDKKLKHIEDADRSAAFRKL